jgi:hypothetical protein
VIASLDVYAGDKLAAAGGQITVTPPDAITVSGPGGEASLTVPDLAEGDSVEVWCGDDWCCLVGEKSKALLVARPAAGSLTIAGELERLDFEGGYDPGGMHRVEFYELPGGDVLLVHELGVARVSPDAGVVWQRGHDDITARVDVIESDAVWLQGENDRFAYSLQDGQTVL